MVIVLDTNVLLASLRKSSPYRPIFDGLRLGTYQLAITHDIFQEYQEIIGEKTTPRIAQNVSMLLLQLEHVSLIEIYYRWELISQDPDDNKFVDCAIAANASYIVSNDRHFQVLRDIPFPRVEVISADSFVEVLR